MFSAGQIEQARCFLRNNNLAGLTALLDSLTPEGTQVTGVSQITVYASEAPNTSLAGTLFTLTGEDASARRARFFLDKDIPAQTSALRFPLSASIVEARLEAAKEITYYRASAIQFQPFPDSEEETSAFPLKLRHLRSRSVQGQEFFFEAAIGERWTEKISSLWHGGYELLHGEVSPSTVEDNKKLNRSLIILSHLRRKKEQNGMSLILKTGLQQGTVYGTLTRLSEKGFVSSKLIPNPKIPKGPKIRVYSLTKVGEEWFQEYQSFFERIS